MSLFGIHLAILTDDQHKIVKAALADAGHELATYATDHLAAAEEKVRAEFPEVIAGIQKGIADYRDATMSGGEKAVAIAVDVLATAPAVIAALPHAKDFLVSLVTKEFAAGVAELETALAGFVGKVAAA